MNFSTTALSWYNAFPYKVTLLSRMIKKIIIKTQNKLQDKAERKKKKDHLCADETQFVPKI